jgi:hypothetical protein
MEWLVAGKVDLAFDLIFKTYFFFLTLLCVGSLQKVFGPALIVGIVGTLATRHFEFWKIAYLWREFIFRGTKWNTPNLWHITERIRRYRIYLMFHIVVFWVVTQ